MIKNIVFDISNVLAPFRFKEFLAEKGFDASLTNIPANSVDYIFTDPPFGENLMYSELNYVSEALLISSKCYL